MFNELAIRAITAVQALVARAKDEEGQTLAEYGLIMAVIAVAVIAAAVFTFKDAIVGAFDDATNCLDSASGGTC